MILNDDSHDLVEPNMAVIVFMYKTQGFNPGTVCGEYPSWTGL